MTASPMHGEYPQVKQREVHPDADAPVTEVLGDARDAGTIEVIKLADLRRDPAYQRPISQDLVDEIARSWDMVAAGPIVVSRRQNGELYIVNGQHRSAAAVQAGESEILAHVINGLNGQDEAILRLKGNKRRNDRSQERFRAQIAAGDPESLHIRECVESLGGHVNTHPDAKTGINGISALEAIYRKDEGVLLVRTLELINDAFGNLDGASCSVSMLKAVAWFLEHHTDSGTDRNRMREQMQMLGVKGIETRARNNKAIMGGTLWVNYYRTMIDAYNERLSDSKRLEVRLGQSSKFKGGGAGGGSDA